MDPTSFGVALKVRVFGVSFSTLFGNLTKGVGIKVDIVAAKGEVNMYLKENALWIHIDLNFIWGNGIHDDIKIKDV